MAEHNSFHSSHSSGKDFFVDTLFDLAVVSTYCKQRDNEKKQLQEESKLSIPSCLCIGA